MRNLGFTFTSSPPDGEAKFWVEPEIELARNHGFKRKQLNLLRQLVEAYEQEIRDAWKERFDG